MGLAASGATRNALTKDMVEGFEVPYFSITLQRQIGTMLGVLDDKIDLNSRMNKTLEAMAHALFKSWFVDSDLFPDFLRISEQSKARFVGSFMRSPAYFAYVAGSIGGSAQPNQKYADMVCPLYDKIQANNIESQTLAVLRNALLPKLISDEIRIHLSSR